MKPSHQQVLPCGVWLALAWLWTPAAALAAAEEWLGGIDATQAMLTYGQHSGTAFALSFACDRAGAIDEAITLEGASDASTIARTICL